MIPSDHFVRFYNEVFKFLDEKGELDEYFARIAKNQEFFCLQQFKEGGLQGVYEYYLKIRHEENCQMDIIFEDNELIMKMTRCPSLSKAIDNDAGVCSKYCQHCLGWTQRIYDLAGLYQIFDLGDWDDPTCCEWIFDDLSKAQARFEEIAETVPAERLYKNF